MRTITITAGIALAALFLIACGGSGDRQLQLPGGDATEAEYRASLRVALLGLQGASLCASLRGLSGPEAYEALVDAQAGNIVSTIPDVDLSQLSADQLRERLAALETGQAEIEALATVAASSDGDRAGQIIQEECKRILND